MKKNPINSKRKKAGHDDGLASRRVQMNQPPHLHNAIPSSKHQKESEGRSQRQQHQQQRHSRTESKSHGQHRRKSPSSSPPKLKVKAQTRDDDVMLPIAYTASETVIGNIDNDISDARTVREALTITFIKNTNYSPIQASLLFAHDNAPTYNSLSEHMNELTCRSMNIKWLQELFSNSAKLCDIVFKNASGASTYLYGILGVGLLSHIQEVVRWTARLLTRLNKIINDDTGWRWLVTLPSSGLAVCVECLHRHTELKHEIFPIISTVAHGRFSELFSEQLPLQLPNPSAFMAFITEILPSLGESNDARTAFCCPNGEDSSPLEQILDIALSNGGYTTTGRLSRDHNLRTRIEACALIKELWLILPNKVNALGIDVTDGILHLLKRSCRSEYRELQIFAISCLFDLFEGFCDCNADVFSSGFSDISEHTKTIWHTLLFSLIENHSNHTVGGFISANLTRIMRGGAGGAVSSFTDFSLLITPYVRRVSTAGISSVDLDFILALACHEHLAITDAVTLLKFLMEICLQDPLFGRAATVPVLIILERHHIAKPIKDVVSLMIKCALEHLLPDAMSSDRATVYATLAVELLSKIIHLCHPEFTLQVELAVDSERELVSDMKSKEYLDRMAIILRDAASLQVDGAHKSAISTLMNLPVAVMEPTERKSLSKNNQQNLAKGNNRSPVKSLIIPSHALDSKTSRHEAAAARRAMIELSKKAGTANIKPRWN